MTDSLRDTYIEQKLDTNSELRWYDELPDTERKEQMVERIRNQIEAEYHIAMESLGENLEESGLSESDFREFSVFAQMMFLNLASEITTLQEKLGEWCDWADGLEESISDAICYDQPHHY